MNTRVDLDKPNPTILKDYGQSSTTDLIHPTEFRRFTIPEIKRLSSFPDEFILTGGYAKQWACIGNAVPPLFMKAIAEHVKMNILGLIPQRVSEE